MVCSSGVGCRGCKRTPKGLICQKSGQNPWKFRQNLWKSGQNIWKSVKNPWKSGQKWRPTLFDLKKWRPTFARKHKNTWRLFLESYRKKVFKSLWEKILGKSRTKIFRASFGKFGQKSFTIPKIYLLLHLCFAHSLNFILFDVSCHNIFLKSLHTLRHSALRIIVSRM